MADICWVPENGKLIPRRRTYKGTRDEVEPTWFPIDDVAKKEYASIPFTGVFESMMDYAPWDIGKWGYENPPVYARLKKMKEYDIMEER